MRRVGLLLLVCIGVSGCGNPNTKADRYVLGDTEALLTSGATRFVNERQRPLPGDGTLPTLCTEPSPDVAIAFAQSAALAAKIDNPSGISGSGNVSYSTSETATALSGRTAGVLALRDGLYAACQTYVNGIIGHDAYALILSQYGNLLVALTGTGTISQATFTAQDAASSALLVSCISEHDPTRLGAFYPDGRERRNPLLTAAVCTRLMERVARGAPLTPLLRSAGKASDARSGPAGGGAK